MNSANDALTESQGMKRLQGACLLGTPGIQALELLLCVVQLQRCIFSHFRVHEELKPAYVVCLPEDLLLRHGHQLL